MIVGGIIPPADAARLKAAGVAAVYTPKDFAINGILGAIVQEVEARFDAEQTGAREAASSSRYNQSGNFGQANPNKTA